MGYVQPVILAAVCLVSVLFLKRGINRLKDLFAEANASEDATDYSELKVREDAYEACAEEAGLKKS